QVEVADRTNEFAISRIVGPDSQSLLEAHFGASLAPLKPLQHLAVTFPDQASGFVRRFDGLRVPAFDVITPARAPSWTESLKIPLADAKVHEILRIEAGLPAFGSDMDEN